MNIIIFDRTLGICNQCRNTSLDEITRSDINLAFISSQFLRNARLVIVTDESRGELSVMKYPSGWVTDRQIDPFDDIDEIILDVCDYIQEGLELDGDS